jgi:hypothetical protein
MRKVRITFVALTLISAVSLWAQTASQKSFDLMKSLTGNWQGKDQMGDPVEVSYRLTANGSALMSEIQSHMPNHAEDMISMIHMDGARLLMTHYCSAGNQPRMQASLSPDGKSITFNFVDATNLASPEGGHMQRVVFTFVDANHHIEEWHFASPGKEIVATFDLQKKS